jgi:hypothetical protein
MLLLSSPILDIVLLSSSNMFLLLLLLSPILEILQLLSSSSSNMFLLLSPLVDMLLLQLLLLLLCLLKSHPYQMTLLLPTLPQLPHLEAWE